MSNNGITVTASGLASGPPDRAVLSLGASAVRGDVAAALNVVNDRITNLVSALADHGVEGPDIQTTDLSIWPDHNSEGTVIGFRVRNTVRVSVSHLEALGEIISSATTVLGDLAEMHGLAFEVADRTALEAQARARAWAVATEKARQLAGLAGTRLGQAVDITESSGRGPAPMLKHAMVMAEATPVEAGSASVEVHMTVRFSQFPEDNASDGSS